MMEALSSSDPHGVTSQKAAFFLVADVPRGLSFTPPPRNEKDGKTTFRINADPTVFHISNNTL
jgi:hypothetical protein